MPNLEVMKVSILMAVRRRAADERCLQSLAQTVEDSIPFEVIIVDCATKDGAFAALVV